MLQVDWRTGSGELAEYLENLKIPVAKDAKGKLPELAYGDMAFLGMGPEGVPVPVGIERKALSDFIQSCRSGRLQGHQLPGLHQCYQRVWILIEGTWRRDWKTGLVLTPKGKGWVPLKVGSEVTYTELMGRVITLREKAGVEVEWTKDKAGTCSLVKQLYQWWVVDGWDKHGSHLGFPEMSDSAMLVKYDRSNPKHMVRLMAKELQSIGWEKSGNIAAQFGSPLSMVLASEKEWASIPGIGKTLAKRLVKVLQGVVE